ncbi:MAG: Ribose-phosphate pyrophosphokinase [Candidatus Bathyarchaeota archaeon BA1]|nr:MAG: Ribose-phosphate pyrophosphokinase [Candidatus Bathyarchaeota archaeon BA1]
MIVVPGPASLELGQKIAEALKAKIVSVEFKRFPDGESYIRFVGNLGKKDVLIVQTTSPPQNENLIQLLLMADNAKDLKAKSVTAVVPYFAYARQDKRFRPGETFSVKTLMKLFEACGVDGIITVNSHNPEILRAFRIPVEDLSAISLLAEHFKKQGFEGAFSLSLGKRALNTAKEASNVLGGGYGYVLTQRDKITGKVTIGRKSLSVKKKDVVVFDDIISSGGTMVEAVKWVREQGARRVYAACVHPLLIGDAKERILKAGADGIVGTDSVPSSVSVVSIARIIAESLTKRGA